MWELKYGISFNYSDCSSPDPNQQLRVDTSAAPELLAYSSNSLMAELTS
jgi:hypothetical protein